MRNLEYSHLSKPLNKHAMMEELNIENPMVMDMVELWIKVRKLRIDFENVAMSNTREVKEELTKFH